MKDGTGRIGFCCKYIPPDGDAATARRMNVAGLTIAYLGRLGPAAAYDKLAAVVAHNVGAVAAQIAWVAERPLRERLLRLASAILPGYTHPAVEPFYADPDLRAVVARGLGEAGALARKAGMRLSMHPGPFCILATASPSALANAVDELEYHADIMEHLGLAPGWHPAGAHINIHVGARGAGIETFRSNLAAVSARVRDLVTVENDETSYGLDDVLRLADAVPVVLDLHHHWIASGGEYVEPGDPRIPRIAESWRGARPLCHVSLPRETLLPDHPAGIRPDFAALTARGIKGRDLMGHSDLMWNDAVGDLVGAHLAWADFEIEAKLKNLATAPLARRLAGASPTEAAA